MSRTFVESIPWNRGDAEALADAERRLTYGQLKLRVDRWAGRLRDQFGSGEYLLLKARPDVRFVVQMLAAMASGNTPVPVNPDSPEDDLRYMLEKCRAKAVLDATELPDEVDGPEVNHADPLVPAMILFTSGTTGYPKGVVISHENLLHSCSAVGGYLDYANHPSAAVVLPVFYSYALLSQVCAMLLVGGRSRLIAEFRNPLETAKLITAENLETFCGVPSTFYALGLLHQMSPYSMPSVRVVCSAGAAMDQSRLDVIRQIFPSATIFNNYGMTEAAPRISYVRDDDPRFLEGTCGRPMAGVEVRVVDPTTHQVLPDKTTGMVVVRGPNITAGYLHDDEQTRKALTSDGFLISGDLGYLDDGYIYVQGRQDDVFNVGGEKVSPIEIERVLNELEMVENSAVVGIRDERRGMVPVAFLKLRRPTRRRELLASLKGRLVPVRIPQRFFEVSSFPMTSNAKLQRRALTIDDAERVVGEIL